MSFKVNLDELNPFADDSLRDYQSEAKRKIYDYWKTHRSVMLQMPTGTGKTRLFVSIAKDFHNWAISNKNAVKVLILAHRHELIDQIDTHLGLEYRLAHGIIMAKSLEQKKYPVQIGSVPTLTRRIEKWADKQFDIVIVDEAHHIKADSYKKIINAYPNAKILGVTATPYRMNGEGFTDEFDGLIVSEPISSFIKKGYLSEYEYYSIRPDSSLQNQINSINQFDIDGDYLESAMVSVMDTEKVRARIVETYLKYANGKKGIVYAITKGHNLHICNSFKKVGIRAAAIDCDTKPEEREKLVNEFKIGKIDVLCNVNIFSEGFDCPDVEFVQLARPTMSLSMYLQQVGRGLRPAQGKEKVIILDNVGQYNKFGFPSANRNWMMYFKGKDEIEPDPIHLGDGHGVTFIDEIGEGDEQVDLLFSSMENDTIINTEMSSTYNNQQANMSIEEIEKEIEILKKYGYEIPESLLKEKERLEDISNFEKRAITIIQELMRKYDIHRNAVIQLKPQGGSSFKYAPCVLKNRSHDEIGNEISVLEKYGCKIPESLLKERDNVQNEELFKQESVSLLIQLMCELDYYHDMEILVEKDDIRFIIDAKVVKPSERKIERPNHNVFDKYNWTSLKDVNVGDEIKGLGIVSKKYSRDELYPNSAVMVVINGKKWASPYIKDFLGIPRGKKGG